jgi:hypothetical protein
MGWKDAFGMASVSGVDFGWRLQAFQGQHLHIGWSYFRLWKQAALGAGG